MQMGYDLVQVSHKQGRIGSGPRPVIDPGDPLIKCE
ncbi:hypothetical protein SAMN05444166_3699 [Singulisphaera sp. GP187]|nr:hypothetical protein SAMN05444166_3699 [Singulisphaera sp. GP187]